MITPVFAGTTPSASELSANTKKPLEKNIQFTTSNQNLPEDTFTTLAKSSGWDQEVQGAMDEPKRLASVLNPTQVTVTAKDTNGNVLGAAGGINFGEYAFMQYLMIDKKAQRSGIGTNLVDQFQKKLVQDNGGNTSIATLSADHINLDTPSSQFYKKIGFQTLDNAVYLGRGKTV